ncbi:hypothetical protein GSI_10980 [Ganoderma sinense ZZ0214-1]|uniref:Uncharacterized protein n=1 Tax=Ganoderma sinense ZZ0214-1 TaxID=1077348 RepID=A0A2G8S234_9APHY|nr:hypothetical protein GSI_10980 [Ganoderma sinense ZZ0214-1]
MPSTVQSSIAATGTSSTLSGNFAWSNFPSTVDTCTSPTLSWSYLGPPEFFLFLLAADPSTSPFFFQTTIAEDVDVAAVAQWTWPQANVTAGEYVVEAYGPDSTVLASPAFVIANGADTSCLAKTANDPVNTPVNVSVGFSGGLPSQATTTWTINPSPETSIPPAQPLGDRRPDATRITSIAVGVAAGAAVFMVILATVLVHRRRLRREQLRPGSAYSDLSSIYIRPATRRLRRTARGAGATSRPLGHGQVDPLPPSPPLSSSHSPAPSYVSHRHTREEDLAGSIIDVSTIESRISATPSDVPSMAELMGSVSSSVPSYTTNPSRPPSYATDVPYGTTTPRGVRMSYDSEETTLPLM